MNLTENEIISRWATLTGTAPKRVGKEWRGLCPIHEVDGMPHNPSCDMTFTEGKALWSCRSRGCDSSQINAAVVGRDYTPSSSSHTYTPPRPKASAKPPTLYPTAEAAIAAMTPAGYTLTSVWTYSDPLRPDYARIARFDGPGGKKYRPFSRQATGGWVCADPSRWTPYRADVISRDNPKMVVVCEGEKAADQAVRLSFAATTSAHGSNSAHKTDWGLLAGKQAVVFPDADPPGEKYTETVAGILHGLGCAVKIVRLPGLPVGGDIVDFVAGAKAKCVPPERIYSDILALVDKAEYWKPATDAATEADDAPEPAPERQPRPAGGSTIQLTDVGNGIRLAQRHGDKIRYVAGIGWHIWDGVRWRLDETQEIQRLAKETCRDMLAESSKVDDSRDREALAKHALASEGNFRLQAMISMAASEDGIAIRAAEMDADPWLLNLKNGIVDLRDGTLHPHQPEFLMTKLAPVVYDPKATCPRFDQFLNEIFDSNMDLLQFVITLLGMCLTGDITVQILPIFWGEGQNGKSTLIGVVMHIMGDYAGLAPDTLLMVGKHDEHPCELADMQGLRLVVASETESAGRLKIQLIKRLTGDPTIKARRMRENYYEFPRT
ncbi:MAG: phage/plasmid primase, P4 family, partial [Phycisphaerae bacterium]